MLKKYLIVFLVSMVPLIELRGGVPIAVGMGLDYYKALAVCVVGNMLPTTHTARALCVVGNMLPVPVIYLFARKVLHWGADKKYIGNFFTFCLEKGEAGGRKLTKKAGRNGLFVALMLFVGIPVPGTGAWTGALAASFLDMGLKTTTGSVCLGVVIAGLIMGLVSLTGVHIFGL